MEHAVSPFAPWESFYVIVGSSAAALTGLQFFVIVLGAEANAVTSKAMRAFGTPTVVHFGATLMISAMLSAPWRSLAAVAAVLGILGVAGLVYLARVLRHAMGQDDYRPVLEDWLWHFIFPAVAYLVLLAAAIALPAHLIGSLFFIGATAMLLLFIGIHNAWDSATYLALDRPGNDQQKP
jgi:hypothetical protein